MTHSPATSVELPAGAAWHAPSRPSVPTGGAGVAEAIRDAALSLGFVRVGFCPIEPLDDARRALAAWLEAGHHGEMAYMAAPARDDARALLPGAKSIIVVAMAYGGGRAEPARAGALLPLTGLVARYARGTDYHEVLKTRLRSLADRCAELCGRPILARPCVDTAPLLEREAARRAGLGFVAKNTMLIAPGVGSHVLLGELLTDIELTPGAPAKPACGACRACLDACPTRAFVDAYTLDARRCISYLTIELSGPIPRDLRPLVGRWVFGCDVCQDVCPFNHSRKPQSGDPDLHPRRELTEPELAGLLEITSAAHRRLVKGSALKRVSRPRLQRNAAVALGNSRDPRALAPLAKALADSPYPLVRVHCAWALGRLGQHDALAILRERRALEQDEAVRAEIDWAEAELLRACGRGI